MKLKVMVSAAFVSALLALPAMHGPTLARAEYQCPGGFVLVNLSDPSTTATFVQVFGSKDANGNGYVCARFASGWRALTVVDDK